MIQRERKKKRGGNFESKKKLQRIHPRPCFYSPSHRETGLHGRQDDCLSPSPPFWCSSNFRPLGRNSSYVHTTCVYTFRCGRRVVSNGREISEFTIFLSLSPFNGNLGGAITGSAIFSNYRYK